jgi:AcrR family transcriptional regulator
MLNDQVQDEISEGRERLMEAALELFTERSFVDVPIHEIAEAAGMTRSAPYYHFRNKEDLYAAVMKRQFANIYNGISERLAQAESFRDSLVAIIDVVAEMSRTPFGRFMNDFQQHMSADIQHSIIGETRRPADFFLPVFQRAYEAGEFHRVTPEFAVRLFFMLLVGYREVSTKEAELFQGNLETEMPNPKALVDFFLQGV